MDATPAVSTTRVRSRTAAVTTSEASLNGSTCPATAGTVRATAYVYAVPVSSGPTTPVADTSRVRCSKTCPANHARSVLDPDTNPGMLSVRVEPFDSFVPYMPRKNR